MGIKKALPAPIKMAYRDGRSVVIYIRATSLLKSKSFEQIRFMSNVAAVDQIVSEGKSLARFGDGEFGWLLGRDIASSYQDVSKKLSKRLASVLNCDNEKMLIGVLRVLNDDSAMNFRAKAHWRHFRSIYQETILGLLDLDRVYVDSSITRPYIDLKDKSAARGEFENLKRIWKGKRVLLVEGLTSRLGVGNDLLECAERVDRVLCPSRNAFDRYEEILSTVADRASAYDIVLLALGPTATILACDLCEQEIQAVDIGHIDNEYEWMRMSAKKKVPIPDKAVDEVGHWSLGESRDEAYKRSIIAIIQ